MTDWNKSKREYRKAYEGDWSKVDNEWISCAFEMPTLGETVQIKLASGQELIGALYDKHKYFEGGYWDTEIGDFAKDLVVEWMEYDRLLDT